MTKNVGDPCDRPGCAGHYTHGGTDQLLSPHPARILKCDSCRKSWFLVKEPGLPDVEGSFDEWDSSESFRDFVDRIRAHGSGPII